LYKLTDVSEVLTASIIGTTNVVAERFTLQLRIQEVPSSDLGLETGYPPRHCM
jgi:hypothetical protein